MALMVAFTECQLCPGGNVWPPFPSNRLVLPAVELRMCVRPPTSKRVLLKALGFSLVTFSVLA